MWWVKKLLQNDWHIIDMTNTSFIWQCFICFYVFFSGGDGGQSQAQAEGMLSLHFYSKSKAGEMCLVPAEKNNSNFFRNRNTPNWVKVTEVVQLLISLWQHQGKMTSLWLHQATTSHHEKWSLCGSEISSINKHVYSLVQNPSLDLNNPLLYWQVGTL